MSFVALWYHLKNLLQQRVLLGTLILWGLDRAGRLGILIWRNCGKRRTTATVEVLPGSVARVDVDVSRAWNFRPGQYMYLYMPCLGLWTSHPFTVAWKTMREDSLNLSEKRSSSDSFAALLEGSQTTTMSVLIKGQDGFTKKLLQKAEDSPEGRIKAMALAEGPFGGIHSLTSYGTLLLVAGGVGITHPMSYLHEVVSSFSSKKCVTRKVHLVWMIRSLGIHSSRPFPRSANSDYRSSGMDSYMDARCLEPRRPEQHHQSQRQHIHPIPGSNAFHLHPRNRPQR